MLRIFNTLTKKIEEFKAIDSPKVGMYSCGPTVYDFTHIGHFRTYVGTDILIRVLKYFEYEVRQVMNITDVGHLVSDSDSGEDKMEKGARREKKTVWEIADFYSNDFFEAMKKLNVLKPNVISKATDNISEMIELIKILEENGFTYKTDDGLYFDSRKLSDYGKLAGQNINDLKAGARIEMVKGKRNPTDFALWKFSSLLPNSSGQALKREMEWESPWGVGFPGWHIECSAMSKKYLGKKFDIHTGGVDHISIHHTNEIAQSEGAFGNIPANYWIHFNFLMVNGQKMSKSTGNIFNQYDLEDKEFSLMDCRYLFLSCHYRDVLNFTWESLEGARTAYKNLKLLVSNLSKTSDERISLSNEKLAKIDNFRNQFIISLENDLNIPQALAMLWQVAKSNIPSSDKRDLILDFDQVLGLNLKEEQSESLLIVPENVKELASIREKYRKEKKWQESDEIRKKIEALGYGFKDSLSGTVIYKK